MTTRDPDVVSRALDGHLIQDTPQTKCETAVDTASDLAAIRHHMSLAIGAPVDSTGDIIDGIAMLRRETDQAGAAELRVRLLHAPLDCRCGCGVTVCTECPSESHPCPTVRALDGEA